MKDEPGAPAAAAAAVTPAAPYRAFISYNHSDAAIAAALASNLTRFARPWYRIRAMRVFLDKNSLSTDPSLSGALERALADSEWLILLASPSSAASPWVGREVEWWLANRGTSKLIIARTAGVIAWQGIAGKDFDWRVTTALPPLLRGQFAAEPLWADLEAAAATRRKSVSNPVFRDGFLGVAAQIHGVSKDALWNRERVEFRTRLAFAALALITMSALVWGVYRTDSVSMERKENITSIQLGAKAFSVLPRDAPLAAQIALVGVALRPSGIAVSALRGAVARIAGEVAPRFEDTSPGAVDLAFSPRATWLAVLSREGSIALLDAATGRPLGAISASTPFEARALAWGAGGTLAVGGRGGVRLWQFGKDDAAFAGPTGPEVAVATEASVIALAFSADGAQLALGLGDGSVRIVSAASGEVARSFVANRTAGLRAIAFGNDGKRLATGAEDGEAILWQLADATPVLRFRMRGPIASVDFNREGDSTVARHMLAVADAGGAVRVVDADAAVSSPGAAVELRAVDLRPGGGVTVRFVQGRCLVRAGAAGPVTAEATLGFEPLFAFGRGAAGAAPRVAMAVGNVPAGVRPQTERPGASVFALLDAAGSIAVYEQPLCGDAEAVCRFAEPWLTTPLSADVRARWVPSDVDLREPVEQTPKTACKALIKRIVGPS